MADDAASAWEEHVDPDSGNTFYFNTVTNETQWERPDALVGAVVADGGAPAASAEAGDAAAAWQELVDPDSGNTYYFNSVTNVTQWEKPDELSSTQGVDTETAVAPTPSDSADAGVANHAEQPSTAAASPGEDQQPPMRRRSTASRRRQSAFGRHTIQRKQSVQPQTVSEKLAARAKRFIQMRKAEKAGSKAAAFATNSAIQSSLKGVSSSSAAAGATTAAEAATSAAQDAEATTSNSEQTAPAEATPALPDGWVSAVDEASGRTFYFNEATNETTWDPPAVTA